ncbi:MAG: SDR family oxidoreductase [Deltaproteobacteria bacterium]|nr:SDR family oxidoreductase [Deltaproteobacteria bacterium]
MPSSIMITGASSGIGKALAFELAKKGYSLALTARSRDRLEEIQKEIVSVHNPPIVSVRSLDVTDYDDVFKAVNELAHELGGLDIVFANAGIGLGERVGRGDFEKARRTIEVNLIGAIATVDAAASYFLKKGKGHIVGTSSVAAFRGMPHNSAYSASKAGFAVYLETVRVELLKKNIHVTVLYPGYIDTPLNQMLKRRPFLISVVKGAAIIADLMEKKVKSSTVPVYPWNIIGRVMKILPAGVIGKI